MCCPWHAALDAHSGLGAAQLQRATSRGLAGSQTAVLATMPLATEFVTDSVRKRVKETETLPLDYSFNVSKIHFNG